MEIRISVPLFLRVPCCPLLFFGLSGSQIRCLSDRSQWVIVQRETIALTFGLTLPYLHHTFIPEKNVKWFKLCIVLFPALPFSSLLFYFYGGWELSFGPVIRNSCLTVTAYPQIRGAHVVRHPLHIDIASA